MAKHMRVFMLCCLQLGMVMNTELCAFGEGFELHFKETHFDAALREHTIEQDSHEYYAHCIFFKTKFN